MHCLNGRTCGGLILLRLDSGLVRLTRATFLSTLNRSHLRRTSALSKRKDLLWLNALSKRKNLWWVNTSPFRQRTCPPDARNILVHTEPLAPEAHKCAV